MKKISLYIASIVLGSVALTSCDDNWEQPPLVYPTIPEDVQANMSIYDLKTMFWQDTESYGTVIGQNNGEDIWIKGKIVSSCASGNIYKSMIVQDATGAITIGIDETNVEELYPMGFEVAINVTGMCIGRYSGLVQLGTYTSSGVNRISDAEFQPHRQIGLKGMAVGDTATVTIAQLLEANKTTEGKNTWQSRLVRIDDIKFVEAGQPFTNGSTTSRYIIDKDGNRMIVYNSSYSDFAYDLLPWGNGSVVGILSCYRTSWQLLLIDANSCIDFDGEGAPDPNQVTLLNEPFGANSQGDFTIEDISMAEGLSYVWKATEKYGMNASGFVNGTCNAAESWLVSPAIDLTDVHDPKVSFSHCTNKFDVDPATQVSCAVRVVGETTWTPVEIPTFSSNADWTFVDSGEIDLSDFVGKKVQFGFHYTSSTASAGTWEVKNVVVTAIKN